MRLGPRSTVLGALASFAALALVGLLSHLSARGRALDADVLEAITRVRIELDVNRALEVVVHAGDPVPYLVVALVIVAMAWVGGSPRLALVLAAVLVLAPLSAEILKVLTAQHRGHAVSFGGPIVAASWPSGHTTGAATAAICALLACPPRVRPALAVLGALYALAMGFSVVALVSHFPSDVLGAYFLSAGWCLLALRAAGLPQRL